MVADFPFASMALSLSKSCPLTLNPLFSLVLSAEIGCQILSLVRSWGSGSIAEWLLILSSSLCSPPPLHPSQQTRSFVHLSCTHFTYKFLLPSPGHILRELKEIIKMRPVAFLPTFFVPPLWVGQIYPGLPRTFHLSTESLVCSETRQFLASQDGDYPYSSSSRSLVSGLSCPSGLRII